MKFLSLGLGNNEDPQDVSPVPHSCTLPVEAKSSYLRPVESPSNHIVHVPLRSVKDSKVLSQEQHRSRYGVSKILSTSPYGAPFAVRSLSCRGTSCVKKEMSRNFVSQIAKRNDMLRLQSDKHQQMQQLKQEEDED